MLLLLAGTGSFGMPLIEEDDQDGLAAPQSAIVTLFRHGSASKSASQSSSPVEFHPVPDLLAAAQPRRRMLSILAVNALVIVIPLRR